MKSSFKGFIVIVLKNFFGILVIATGISWFIREVYARRKVTIILYHSPLPDTFREHLSFLSKHYNLISFSKFYQAYRSSTLNKLPLKSLVITLDDGYRQNFELAEIAAAYGAEPFIYLCSQIVGTKRSYWWKHRGAKKLGVEKLKAMANKERLTELEREGFRETFEQDKRTALSWEEVKVLKGVRFEFGSHTRFHPILPQCKGELTEKEIRESKAEIEEVLHEPCEHFSYPNGSYTQREIELLKQAGYVTGRTVDVGWNTRNTDLYLLKAISMRDNASTLWMRAQLTGIPALVEHSIQQRKITCKAPQFKYVS